MQQISSAPACSGCQARATPTSSSTRGALAPLSFGAGALLAWVCKPRRAATGSSSGRRSSAVRRRSAEADALAEAEALTKEAAALRAEAAKLQESEAADKRAARAWQIIGPTTESIDRDGIRGWLKELRGLDDAAADKGAGRLMATCGAGKSALTFEDLSSPAFDAELEKVLGEAREAAAKAQREEEERAKQARQEKESLLLDERRPWRPETLNDDRETGTRVLSALVYLVPLIDSIFGAALASESEQVPILSSIIAALSAPIFLLSQFSFGTQILWFLLTLVASNRRLPRLLRFSMQQAVFLDVAYLGLSVVASVEYYATGGEGDVAVGYVLPIVAAVSLVVAYAWASALLGREADGLPLLSKYTSDWIDGPPPPGFGSDED